MDRFNSFHRLRNLLLAALGAAVLVAVFYILARHGIGIPCVFRLVTGFQCPGCGNSRAALALLRLDIRGAFSYNPMFLPEFFYVAWVLFHCSKSYLKGGHFTYPMPCKWLDITLLAAVLVWWLLRNLL